VELALVAFVTEVKVDVLTVAAEPVTDSLRVVPKRFRHILLRQFSLNLLCFGFEFESRRGRNKGSDILNGFRRFSSSHVTRGEARNKFRGSKAHRCSVLISFGLKFLRTELIRFKRCSKTISTGRLSVDLFRVLQMFRKSLLIFDRLNLFASETRSTAVKVVVEALSTYPAVLREFKTFLSPSDLM
jgi:hypothetical protein